jgi:hypothetical protein
MSNRTEMAGVEGWCESETGLICIGYPPGIINE